MAGCGTIEEPEYVAVTGNPEVKVVDSDGDIVTIDEATGAITIIEYEHYEIHAGSSFQCWYEQTVSDTGDRTIITFRTPNTARWVHMVPKATSTDLAHASILEAPNVVDDTGAIQVIYNHDRNSATTSTVWDTSQNPDVQGQATYFTEITMGNVAGGTEIAHAHLGAGGGPRSFGGGERAIEEWILKQNTLYAFVVESDTNNDNICVIELNWYEHTNED